MTCDTDISSRALGFPYLELCLVLRTTKRKEKGPCILRARVTDSVNKATIHLDLAMCGQNMTHGVSVGGVVVIAVLLVIW